MQNILKNPLGSPGLCLGLNFYFNILALAKYKQVSAEIMILTGVVLGSPFIAETTAMQYFADGVQIASNVFWTFGDVGRAIWGNLLLIVLVFIPLTYLFYL